MSTAIAFSTYGEPEILEAIEVEKPRPGAGQVLIRVRSAGVQPFDARVRRGELQRWVPVRFPQILGNEFAGEIEEVGRGVGTFAVQLAREWGATVIGTASDRNHGYLRQLGANPVAYGPGLADRVRKLAPHGVDAALDAVGGEAIPVSLELVENKNRVGTIADHGGAAKYGVSTLGGVRTTGRLTELVELYEQGRLRVHIQNAHPLRNAPQAHQEVETGHVRGKVVLTVG